MVLFNGSKRARYANTTANQYHGRGPMKIGLPYQVGRTTSVSIAFKFRTYNTIKKTNS